MRRLFWLAMGVTIGALLVRKLSRAAQKLTPSGMATGVAGALAELADAIRDFAADVREAMSEREAELRVATGLDGSATPHDPAGTPGADS
jgi:chromosome condensin MukBEF MukE localization factor